VECFEERETTAAASFFFKEGYRRITDDEASYAMRDFFGNRIRSDPECTRRSPCFLPSFTLFLLKDDRPFSSGWKKNKERRCRPPQCKVDEEQL